MYKNRIIIVLQLVLAMLFFSCSHYDEDDTRSQIKDKLSTYLNDKINAEYIFIGVGEGDSGCYEYHFKVILTSKIDQFVKIAEEKRRIFLKENVPYKSDQMYGIFFYDNIGKKWKLSKLIFK